MSEEYKYFVKAMIRYSAGDIVPEYELKKLK